MENAFSPSVLNQLLDINKAITKTKTSVELLSTIREKVMELIPFHDTGILIVEKDGSHHYDLSVSLPGWDDSEANLLLQQQERLFRVPHTGSYTEFVMIQLKDTRSPSIEDWENTFEKWDHPFFPVVKQIGHKESLVALLKMSDRTLGTLWLNSLQKNSFSKDQFPLFQAIAEQVSVAVANILANVDLVEREKEKTLLYKIASAIANVKDRTSLMKLILEEVKNIFQFYDVGLAILDSDGVTCTDWSTLTPEISPSEANYEIHARQLHKIPFKDSLFEKLIQQVDQEGHPLIIKFNEQLKANNPELKDLFEVEMKHGYNEALFTYLKSGDKIIGSFNINSLTDDYFKPRHYNLFQAVADLIAVAVANILANENILEREKDKSTLLEITTLIAQVKDKEDLLKLIVDKIKPIFNFHDCGLFIISKDGEHHSDLAAVLPDVSISDWNLKIASLSNNIRHKNSPVEWMVESLEKARQPILMDFKDLVEKFPDYPQLNGTGILEMGYRDCLTTTLKVGGQVLGMFCINALSKNFFQQHQFTTFQSVSDILAIAVANILANEEIISLNKQLEAQNEYLIEEVEEAYNFEEMIGQNPKFTEVCKSIGLVAKTDSTVLILGETGTGKELVARAIHNHSPRKNKPLIKLNCAALPASLIESELFGHERGAFTGAIDRRIGKFELANGSTLFLDEVGELPIELQAKLLRALQEKEIERLGSNKTMHVDVRIIAATNRDLLKEIQAGKFRQDLYYRLHIFPITLPALRERKEDVPLLAAHFIKKYAKKTGKNIQGLDHNAMQEMMTYNWPGNIRELEHVIERCTILSKTKLIKHLELPDTAKSRLTASSQEFVLKSWHEQERDYILEVLKLTNGNVKGKGGAAELLQLPPTTLQSKMNKLGIKRKHFLDLK